MRNAARLWWAHSIVIGAIFLFVNVFHIDFGQIWPIIFYIIGAGFYLPVLLMPRDRRNLSSLLIPGTILFGLGTIFFYNIFADDWGSWAYIWTLIPASVGLACSSPRVWANGVAIP
jgi:hypothetical protein